MKLLHAIIGAACASAVSKTVSEFEAWTKEHKKSYETLEERDHRYEVFENNMIQINAINNDPSKTWTAGTNKFSDMTWDEFKHDYLMQAGQNCSATSVNGPEYMEKVNANLPEHFDWRRYDAVSPIKDQGQCGSCWTFSTSGNIEAAARIHLRENHIVAEQQLVDCAQNFNNHGCNGGLPSQAFEYIHYAPGIMSEKDYPYTAKDGSCAFDATKAVVNVYGSVNITATDELEMQQALVGYQPVSIAFEVVDDFMHYKDGVYSSTKCKNGPEDVNHAVLAVGYGVEHDDHKRTKFWDVKNSWGTSWGNKGYFRIERGVNMCGLAQCTSFALIDPDQLIWTEL